MSRDKALIPSSIKLFTVRCRSLSRQPNTVHQSLIFMNTIGKFVSFTIAAVGIQMLLTAQVLALPTSLVTSSNRMQVSNARSIHPMVQGQGDSPDMEGREGVPPSAGSGSR